MSYGYSKVRRSILVAGRLTAKHAEGLGGLGG